jgi:hypothetical protein
MKLLLFLLLLITANAKVAVLDIATSSHLKSGILFPSEALYVGSGADGCDVLNFDGTVKKAGGGGCPSGSMCIDGIVPTCKTLTKVVHQGANGYDFETENVVNAPTQIAGLVTWASDKTDSEATSGAKDKFLLYRLHLQNVNVAKYSGCEVSIGGAMVDAVLGLATPGSPPAVLALGTYTDTQVAVDKQFLSAGETVSCEFRLVNHGYMGLVTLNVSFTKVELQMDIGEKAIDSVEAHVRFVPGSDDNLWHNPQLNAASVATLFPDHSIAAVGDAKYVSKVHGGATAVLEFETTAPYADGYLASGQTGGASADKGTVKLPVKATFYDLRYKVVDQSGVESLSSNLGNGQMRKEGMDIHFDFVNFYNADQNSFTNDQIGVNPVSLYSAYTGTRPGYAEYELKHTYTFKYGGYDGNEMPHFQKEYLSCALCEARVVFAAFRTDGAYSDATFTASSPENNDYLLRYHVPIVTANLPTAANNIMLDDVDVDLVKGVDGHSELDDGTVIALRLPTAIDPQYPNGHAVGEFFSVKKAETQIAYTSLISDYTILDSRLTVTGGAAMVDCGAGYGKGPLYQLGSDIVAKAQEIFDRDCRITLAASSFGASSTLVYTPVVIANAKTSTILQTDDRQIMAGNTELSILRRKTDTSATNSGPQVTFSVSKVTGNTDIVKFKVKGSNTMLGYGNDGIACTQAQVCAAKGMLDTAGVCGPCASAGDCASEAAGLTPPGANHADWKAYGKQCKGVLDAAAQEGSLDTKSVDGVSTEITIRSSSDCFLYMDVELQTLDSGGADIEFAAYALRLPCVRTTDQLNDELNLTYAFETSYSLSKDEVTGEIDYSLPTGMGLSVLNAGFGSCGKNASNFDELYTPSLCVDAAGLAQPVDGWLDDGSSKVSLAADDKVDLATLKLCDTAAGAAAVSADGNSYVLSHYLGLVYRRDYLSGGRTKSRTYCQDQKFVTTIRRDATASVSVATLVSPTLARSVMVSGLDWVQCSASDQNCKGSANCYKYRIDLDVTEQSDGGAWANASLSNAFLPGSGGVNTDSMLIVEALSSNTHKNYLSLESSCGPIDACDSTSVRYSEVLDGTEQDIVIRGAFEGVNVDTAVNIQTKFEECPLEKATVDLGGILKIGMGLKCASADGSGGWSPVGTGPGGDGAKAVVDSEVSVDSDGDPATLDDDVAVKRCSEALASAMVEADAQVFLDGRNSTGLANALSGGWKFRDIDWTIERFERDLLGNKDPSKRISSDLIFEMRFATSDYTCTRKTDILFGLPNAFDSSLLGCPGTADSGLTSAAQTESAISKIKFDLAPLQSANMDVFEVRVDAILRNTNLDTRRLRGILQLNLRADGALEASSGGFTVLPASKEISDAIYESPDKPEEHTANNVEVIMIIAIAVLSLIVLVLAIRCCLSKSGVQNKARAVAGMNEAENAPMLPNPEEKPARFSNLRY